MADYGQGRAIDAAGPFVAGAVVLVSLSAPREKFWGVLLGVSPAGVAISGIDLNSFDDFVALVRGGEAAGSGQVFFPMHRVERIEVDAHNGGLPSMAERFESATGARIEALIGIVSRTTIKQ